jgi:Lrp/AsnC family transcriptional regulator, leucine-responsive regulatory protein
LAYYFKIKENSEQMAVDATDLLILDQLQTDASITNQVLAERVFTSPPTCLRRVKRLKDLGLIERQIAILNPDKIASILGHGLTAIVEITLDRQDIKNLEQFEARVSADDAVQQCYRVSPGPDFVLIVFAQDMPAFLALSERLFTADTNVRNVKVFFSVKRAKFQSKVPVSRV